MTRRTRELLVTMAKLNQAVPTVVLSILDDSLTVDKQIEFADLLVDVGRLVHEHAQVDRTPVIDSADVVPDATT